VDKNGPFSSLDIEVVVVVPGDGEIPHPAVVVSWDGAAVGDRGDAVRGFEMLAFLQLGGSHPLLQ